MATAVFPAAASSKDQFEHWQHLTDSTYGPTANLALRDGDFHGRLQVNGLGPVKVSHISSTPVQYHREQPSSLTDSFFITLTLCAVAHLQQHGRASIQRPGDIAIFDGSLPYTCAFPEGDNQVVLEVPRALMLHHLATADQMVSRTLPAGAPLAALAGTLMQQALSAGPLPDAAAQRLGASVLDILANVFELTHAQLDLRDQHHAEKLQRVKRHVQADLGNTGLTLESVAQATQLSPRSLSRLFAREGTSFSRWLWQERLSACHAALLRGQFRNLTELALTFGFSNMAHFSRAFRQVYGIAPSQLLVRRD